MKKTFKLSYGDFEMSHSDDVKAKILNVGIELWPNVTARAIARTIEPNMSHTAILYHFGSAELLALDIARYAVATGNSKIIAQLIVNQHPAVAHMAPATRRKHMQAMGH